jgi:membrane protein required for colicin V production
MNWIDIFIAVPLAYAMWKGFQKGFVLEIFSLLALLVGLYVGIHFSTWVSKAIASSFSMNPVYLPIVSFMITFGGVALLVYFTGKTIEKMLKSAKLTSVNKAAGAGFGGIKALFFLSAGLLVLDGINEKTGFLTKETMEASLFYNPVKQIAPAAIPALKESGVYIKNTIKGADSLSMKVEDILRAKEIADSLGITVDDVKHLQDIHEKYGK